MDITLHLHNDLPATIFPLTVSLHIVGTPGVNVASKTQRLPDLGDTHAAGEVRVS